MAPSSPAAHPSARTTLALLLFACAACADGGDDAAPVDAAAEDGGAASCDEELSLCDIRELACMERLAITVGCLRGRAPVIPNFRLLTEEQYAAELRADQPPEDPSVAATLGRWYAGLARFHLALAEASEQERAAAVVEYTGASYSHPHREIVVIDRGMPLDDAASLGLLAHELVHAQQYMERDLTAWAEERSNTQDRYLASVSVYEGEAVHYQLLLQRLLRGESIEDADWDGYYARWQARTYERADTDDAPFATAIVQVPYAFGGAFVTRAWLRDGQAGVDALYDAPPRSSREVIFGDAEGEAEARDALRPIATPSINLEYVQVNQGALGAWLFRAFLRRAGLSEADALRAAEALGADVFTVQAHRTELSLVCTWRVQLLEGAELDWVDALELGDIALLRDGELLTFLSAEPAVIERADTIRWRPLRE